MAPKLPISRIWGQLRNSATESLRPRFRIPLANKVGPVSAARFYSTEPPAGPPQQEQKQTQPEEQKQGEEQDGSEADLLSGPVGCLLSCFARR